EWIEAFERAAMANNWTGRRRTQIASGYLTGIAVSWYDDNWRTIDHWDDDKHRDRSFVPRFVEYFATPERRHKWQMELNTIIQKNEERVDTYAYWFKQLLRRVNSKHRLPTTYV